MKQSGHYPLERTQRLYPARVALTGGTGFIGSAVLNALLSAGIPTAAFARNPATIDLRGDEPGDGRRHQTRDLRVVTGQLADSDALTTLCTEARILIHAASYVGPDPDFQHDVNVAGTRAVVDAARRCGVERIVYLSTAGVYGGALGPGFSEDEAAASPRSPLSRSRRSAEQLVLGAGGIVIRPHLVHGTGDRWFLTQLLAAMLHLDAWIGGPHVALSTIGRARLGNLVVSLAFQGSPGIAYHAAERTPARVRDLVEPVYLRLGALLPQQTLTPAEASVRLEPLGVTREQVDLIGTDSWFQTERIWSIYDRAPHPADPPDLKMPEGVDWYAAALRGSKPRRP